MAAAQPTNLTGFEPEIQDITRQREMAKLLLQQGMQSNLKGQMVGNVYVPSHPLEGIADVYSAYKGRKLAKEADQKQADLAKLIREEGIRDIGQYMSAMQGKPEVPEVVPQGQTLRDDQGQMTMGAQAGAPAVAPDYNKALAIALNSRSPMVQALGGSAISQMATPQKLAEGEQFVRFNPQTNTYDTIGGGGPKLTNDIRNYQYDVSQGYKGTFNQWNLDQKKASAQNINISSGMPFQEKIFENSAIGLMKDFDTLKSIPSQVKTLDRVAQLAPKSFAGSAANAKLEGAKFLNNNLGLNIAPDKIVATEELRTVLFTNIMDNLKKMDASPSQEQQRIMQASLGNIGTDPAALPAVVNVYKQILLDKANEHNSRVDQTVEKGFKYPYSIKVNVPTAEAPKSNPKTPVVGEIQNGWEYIGGNPAVPTSWKRAK